MQGGIALGVVTGLRAIDIAKLKLNDIDWLHGEIKLTQSKTGKTLVLPLTTDVGEAIQDYILHGRPKSEDDVVFLRGKPPYIGLKNGNGVGDMFDDYLKRLNL